MTRIVTISRVALSYSGGLVLHTASSGAVPVLEELRLTVRNDGTLRALGACRINIAYLSGVPAEEVVRSVLAAADALDWTADPESFRAQLDVRCPGLVASARMLFEMAAADGAARDAGTPLAVYLGGVAEPRVASNQTLFLSGDAELLDRAAHYVSRGFRDLKLRIGFGAFSDDLRRLRLLRNQTGPDLMLSADANGSWNEAEARERLNVLAPLGMNYLEQPVPAGDWDMIARIAAASPVPLMLDESLNSQLAVSELARRRLPVKAHIKLAKLGGLDRLMAAGRELTAAGIDVMVGQMNEGVVSTLAAAHAAVALRARHCELYGADGLLGDPVGTLRYVDGFLELPPGPGLGTLCPEVGGPLLWEKRL